MRILVTGASGVLGRVSVPLLNQRGHVLATPSSGELNLFDAEQVGAAIDTVGAVLHLASRIPTANQMSAPGAWQDNEPAAR